MVRVAAEQGDTGEQGQGWGCRRVLLVGPLLGPPRVHAYARPHSCPAAQPAAVHLCRPILAKTKPQQLLSPTLAFANPSFSPRLMLRSPRRRFFTSVLGMDQSYST